MAFDRSVHIPGSDPREIPNAITSYLDGSVVYGETPARALALRSFSNGKLKSQTIPGLSGEYPPYNDDGSGGPLVLMDNGANRVPGTSLFAVGDRRGNENMILLALHVLFLREHNRICDTLTGDDETRYQTARQLVTAYIQAITFQEYLPTLFNGNIKPYIDMIQLSTLPSAMGNAGVIMGIMNSAQIWIECLWKIRVTDNPDLAELLENVYSTTDEIDETPFVRGSTSIPL